MGGETAGSATKKALLKPAIRSNVRRELTGALEARESRHL